MRSSTAERRGRRRANAPAAEDSCTGERGLGSGVQQRRHVLLVLGQGPAAVDAVNAEQDAAEHAAELVRATEARSRDAEVDQLRGGEQVVLAGGRGEHGVA